ncbi:hypothetical protein [Nocardia thailandica]|uniref:hypothetical protein n=1 Tax=Nocardia thailandica TaxID=257275 RepID=UPI00031393AD|nr:hypothetical protein [Nocardia thailandica]
MITTTYRRTRAARLAAARIIGKRLAGAQAVRLVRALRSLNGVWVSGQIERGEIITVSQAMTALGADAELVRRFASHAGKRIKAAWIAHHGAHEPMRIWKFVHDRPRQVAAYKPADPAIRDGLAAYDRTAHLVAA